MELTECYTDLESKTFCYEFSVILNDCDVFGHASYSHYIHWQNLGIQYLFLSNLIAKEFIRDQVNIKTYSSSMHYKKGVVFSDRVIGKVNVSNINKNGCEFYFTFNHKKDNSLIGLGVQKAKFIDCASGETRCAPDEVLNNVLRPIQISKDKIKLHNYE